MIALCAKSGFGRLHALRLVLSSFSDLLIPVLFRQQHRAPPGTRGGGRVDLLSILSVHSHRCFR